MYKFGTNKIVIPSKSMISEWFLTPLAQPFKQYCGPFLRISTSDD